MIGKISLAVFAAFGLALTGCGPSTGPRTAAAPIMVKVIGVDGKPLKNVTISFSPTTGNQLPGDFILDDSGAPAKSVQGGPAELIPGTYSIYFQEGSGKDRSKFATAFKAVPKKYTLQGQTGIELPIGSAEQTITLMP